MRAFGTWLSWLTVWPYFQTLGRTMKSIGRDKQGGVYQAIASESPESVGRRVLVVARRVEEASAVPEKRDGIGSIFSVYSGHDSAQPRCPVGPSAA